ncbi:FKBP-type peptidyl-prolyl cis-trans isomerase [Micromonospora sp. NPDC003197]
MSDRVQSRTRTAPTDAKASTGGKASTGVQPLTKAEKRAAAKAAKARAAAAKRRRKLLTNVLAGVAVVGVLVAAVILIGRAVSSDGNSAGAAGANASTGAKAFPPLPEGADPALGIRPTPKAGEGELTKLTVTPMIEGTGPAAATGQTVTVNYVGVTYKDGKEFDASWNDSETLDFRIGTGEVLKGWDQGLVGVKVGSRVQLDIPSELAYGDTGRVPGPLRFVVDVLAVE